MPCEQKEEYLMKTKVAIKMRRENQTEQERQEELAANSIRNMLAKKMPGPRMKLSIRRIDSSLSSEENMRRNAHRNMLTAKHSLPVAQKKVSWTLKRVVQLMRVQERFFAGIQEGRFQKGTLTSISQQL